MPGPCNSKRKKRQQLCRSKAKANLVRKDVADAEQHAQDEAAEQDKEESHTLEAGIIVIHYPLPLEESTTDIGRATLSDLHVPPVDSDSIAHERPTLDVPSIPSYLEQPFISDPGNGPRVKDAHAFLSSFFCPPPSLDDQSCAAFARAEILHVLEAVLPREIALIMWYNKTRLYNRICPACQRLYRLGDALSDPISGASTDVRNPETPHQVLREQQISGICSSPCFLLASYTSHPYVVEVARGAWGVLHSELDAQTRSLLDATDPATAALLRYGISAWDTSQDLAEMLEVGDLGLGRALRMTRRHDLGLGDVINALAWADGQEKDVGGILKAELRECTEENIAQGDRVPLVVPRAIRA